MKKAVAVLMIVTLCLAPACSDDNPSAPNIPDDTLLTSATIGEAGGMLSHDGFVMNVPAGTFSGTVSLELYESSVDHGFGDDVISPLYRIAGLPETTTDTLHVRIACTGQTSEECFVLHGDPNDDATLTLLPAIDSQGVAVATIPPREPVNSDDGLDLDKRSRVTEKPDYFAVVANHKASYATPLFTIIYPAYLVDYVDDLASYVDEAKTAVENLGMSFDHDLWTWPGQIIIKELRSATPSAKARFQPSMNRAPTVILSESAMTLAQLPNLRVTMHRSVMATAQFAYDREHFSYIRNSWWHEAVRQWFPSIVPGSSVSSIPSHYPGNEYEPFKGFFAGLSLDTKREHGFGLASFVRYLELKYGKDVIGQIYSRLALNEDLYEAIVFGAGEDVYNWLPEYVAQLLQGILYPVPSDTLTNHIESSYSISSAADTLASLYRGCPELGTQLYRIDLDYDSIGESAQLDLTVTGSGINQDYVTLLVFTLTGSSLNYVGAGNNVAVSGLRDLTQSGRDIIAVVVNSYSEYPHTSTTPVTFTARVNQPREFDHNKAEINIFDITFDCYEEWKDTTSEFSNHHGVGWVINGEFAGNVFHGLKTSVAGDYVCTTSVSIEVDPITLELVGFEAWEHCGTATYRQSTSIVNVPGTRLPFVGSEQYLHWRLTGTAAVCNYFEYEGVIRGYPPQYDHWYQVCNNASCTDGDPEIRVQLYKE